MTEFICTNCPLLFCDEESLWCAFRWATNPNKAQLEVATVRLIPQRLTDAERSRRWRQKNRERYNEVQRDYRAKKRANKTTARVTSPLPRSAKTLRSGNEKVANNKTASRS